MQSRWRSKAAWMAALSLILFVSKTYFGYEIPEGDRFVDLILLVATAFGIWNNPERSDGY